MQENRIDDILQHVRQIVRPEPGAGLGDDELLRRWVAQRDEAAFEVLLWRHGPMVLGVCRRVLRDAHEAEDALQATFLAPARKAASIGRREAVAGWLYRVAFRAALEAKTRAAKRPALDAESLASVTVGPLEDLSWRDLRPVLDEEVNRLPMKYRVPFVLRHLEGRTNEQVARELGCPVGTVLSRVARARERLRARLTRRGVALSAGALAAGLRGKALAVTVPLGIIGPLVQAATVVATGGVPPVGLVSTNAAALAEGVVRGMAITKLKVLVALVLALSLFGTGGAVLAHRLVAGSPAAPSPRAEQQPAVNETREKPGQQPEPAQPKKADEARRAEKRAAEVDAAQKQDRPDEEERAVQRDKALKRLLEAQDVYRAFEEEFTKVLVLRRQDLVREEESLRALEREQAAEREREREQIKAADAALLKAGRGNDKQEREQLKELEQGFKKREAERTERLIVAREKMVRAEESLRQLRRDQGLQRELAQARVRAAAERVLQLEEDRPAADPQVRALREVERKVEGLLREIGDLRRAVEKQQPSKDRAPKP